MGDLQSNYESTTCVDILKVENDLKIYPNPFHDEIIIEFELNQNENIYLAMYNIAGQLIKVLANQDMNSGNHKITWDARDGDGNTIESGSYIYKYMVNSKIISSGQITYIH